MEIMKWIVIALMLYSFLNHLEGYREGRNRNNSLFNLIIHAAIIAYIIIK